MTQDLDESTAASLPGILARMLQTPFPVQADPPDDTFSWDRWQSFFANAPDRLVHLIAGAYHDYEADDEENQANSFDTLWYARDERYRALYRRCVPVMEGLLGPRRIISSSDLQSRYLRSGRPEHPGFEQDTPAVLLNPEAINFSDRCLQISWWRVKDRLVLLHYVGDQGDGDFQFAVSLCVLADVPQIKEEA